MTTSRTDQYDLRSLFKAIGRVGGRGGENAAVERSDTTEEVNLLENNPLEVKAEAAAVCGFVDGIQSTMHLTHIDRRPVTMYYVAAGALGEGATPKALVEKLRLQCASEDVEWVESLGSRIPVEVLGSSNPPDLELEAQKAVGAARDKAERTVIDDLIAGTDAGLIAVDGSLLARPRSKRLVGVVKTTKSRYLSDETVIWSLRRGWRSPRFAIGTGENLRYSCYVQLVEKGDGAWNLGLVRLESFDLENLEPMAARCLQETQTRSSNDPRWDRHLGSVRAVEEFLRARRPAAFTL